MKRQFCAPKRCPICGNVFMPHRFAQKVCGLKTGRKCAVKSRAKANKGRHSPIASEKHVKAAKERSRKWFAALFGPLTPRELELVRSVNKKAYMHGYRAAIRDNRRYEAA